jgi:hypothetical protein
MKCIRDLCWNRSSWTFRMTVIRQIFGIAAPTAPESNFCLWWYQTVTDTQSISSWRQDCIHTKNLWIKAELLKEIHIMWPLLNLNVLNNFYLLSFTHRRQDAKYLFLNKHICPNNYWMSFTLLGLLMQIICRYLRIFKARSFCHQNIRPEDVWK